MTERFRWPRTLGTFAGRSLIRMASVGVPSKRRAEWIEEWESELWHLVAEQSGPSVLDFCRGAVLHALWERRSAPAAPGSRSRFRPMGALAQDIRYTLRSFRTAPSFFVIAVLTLAIGIGAATAIFSVVDGVLLRSLPYKDPSQLVVLGTVYTNTDRFRGLTSTSAPNFQDWRERTTSFASMGAVMNWQSFVLYGGREPESVRVADVSSELFSILGIGPAFGRTFAPEEYDLGSEPVAILSHGLWQRRFGGDESILGRTITDAEKTFTVVGIMPADLKPPEALWVRKADLWMPVDLRDPEYADRNRRIMRVVARLKSGVTIDVAREEIDALATALIEEYPDDLTFRGITSRIGIEEIHRETVGDVGERLYVLLGAVGFLLLIACANVANLTLARGTARSREMALRAALGAGRSRLIRQVTTESVLVALASGAAGVTLAFLGVKALSLYEPGDIPRFAEVSVDLRILAFALGVSVLTGLLFSLAPVFQNSRSRIGDALKDGAKGTIGTRGSYLRKTLVIVETALALMLLVGAGLLMNSFVRLARVDPGFNPKNVYAVPVRLDPSYTMEQRDPFFRELVERVTRLPNVQTVSAVMNLPIGDVNWRTATFSERVTEADDAPPVNIHMAYPGYFGTIGIRLLEGRDFTAQDRPGQPEVAIVNESLARLHWPEGNAIGRRLRIGFGAEEPAWVTVVGIVNDVHQEGLASVPISELYRPYPQGQQDWMSRMYIVVKHSGEEAALAVAVRDEVSAMDSKLPLSGLGSLETRISDSIRKPRFYSSLLTAFAIVALILAGAGIYGTLLYSVGQRSREVGIRMALGAKAEDVTRLIVAQGMTLVMLGVAAGLMGAYAASKFLESFLFGVTSHDAPTFAAVALALALVGLVACYSPARRAARTDPVTTLRSE